VERDIIVKFINRTANADEIRQVLVWLEETDTINDLLKDEWNTARAQGEDITDYHQLLHRIHRRASISSSSYKSKPTIVWAKIFRIAASLIFLVGSMYFILKVVDFEDPIPVIEERLIQRQTGIGEKLTLKLPDGTIIVLNANSTIGFSSAYGKKNRHVQLTGEGFFQIAKDSLRPFILETKGISTRALGTAFNAYSREGLCAVALTEGKVAITSASKTLLLKPGQIMFLDMQDSLSNIKVEGFDYQKVVGWKEGILNFNRVSLRSILSDLANWYGVKMDIDEGLNVDRRVIGTFRNKNLIDVLTGLGFSMGFEYSINKKVVKIKKRSL
jgi:ferric-dicitrate binding protein FerR (iron transport regulator)